MRESLFVKYLNLNRHLAVAEQLYAKQQITHADLEAVRLKVSEIEMDMITPKRNGNHPRKLSVIE